MKKIINCPLVKRALAFGLMLYGLCAYGATYHVAKTGDDATVDGTNPETPYATLKAALGVAQKGDKIKIVGTITLPETTADLQLTVSGVELFGDGPDKSCLDFSKTAGGIKGFLKLTEGAFVHNLKLYKSRNDNGVIRIAAGESDVVVSNCWIDTCNFSTRGQPGGSFSDGLVTHTLFSGNNCNYGPVVSIGGNAKVRNCIFTRNSISSSRTDTNHRYGIFYLSDSALFENNTVYGNYANYNANYPTDVYSAGLYISGGSPTIRNNIVSYNFIHGAIGSATAVESNYLCKDGAAPVATHNASSEGFGENAVTVPPTFANLDMSLTAEKRDFTLAEGSSCIDAGLFQNWHLTATDFALNNRFQGCSVDIGAYEVVAPLPNLVIVPNKESYEGAQEVLLTAKSDNGTAFLPNTRFVWTVDGVEENETSSVLVRRFVSGTYRITATAANCSYFTASFELTVQEVQGVGFSFEETAGIGRKSAKFTPFGTAGLVISDAAAYAWFVNDEKGAGAPVSTEKTPVIEFAEPGVYSVLLRVTNADGNGAEYEYLWPNAVTVETLVVGIELSETAGEGRTPIVLSAKVEGLFEPDEEATYEWRWTNLDSETPDMTGAVVTNAFYAGTHSVRLVLKNADGNGLALTNTLVSAIEILPGPDFHVSASGSDEAGFGSKSKPYATLKKALENATKGQKIRITGMVKENFAHTLKGVELFGDGPSESGLETASQYNAYLTLKEGATVHGLKISGSRSNAGVLRIPAGEDSSAVSNCWLSGNYYSTAGNPGGGFSAGLVTHSLFSGNSCNYGPVVSAEGTAKIRNCIFTGNYIKSDGVAQNRLGVVQLAGSAVFENNTVYGNYSAKTANSEHHSAGLYVPSGSPVIRNNIVSYNFIHGAIGSETAVESNYLYKDGATPVATHNASGEGFGEAAVTERPVFANLDMSLAAEKRDFTLAENSSCIDRGVAIDWLADAIDYAGKRRVQGWAVDIGACEADGKTLFFDIAAQANVVTGAQSVAFAVTGDTAYIPQNADIRWFVDGEEAEARGTSVSLPLEEGRHDIAVDLGGFFRVEKKDFIFVKTPQAVVIATGEVQGNGRKTVTFTAVAKGFEFAETARFEWYWNATGEGEIAATGNPVEAVFRPGSHDAFVRVTDADGEGAVFETNLLAAVMVEQMSAKIRLSGTFGEGSKSVVLTAVPTGFAIEPPAVCTWVWTREEDGATGTLTGNPAIGVFTAGTYAFSLEIANADGEGAVVTASLASGALRIYAPQNVEIPSGQGTTSVYLDQLGEIPFKTVNGRPITGAGDMTVVSADSYRAVEDVSDHGAVGDGRSDDTAAIMAALEAAYASGKPLYFPRSAAGSVYLTRKGLILKSSLTITADPGAVLANASAVLDGGGQTISTPLAETMPKGATSCKVYNVAGLKVGQEVTIGDASSYGETLADITAIDPETKTVTFDTSRYVLSGVNTGALKEMPKNSAVLMTDFSLVKSVGTIAAVNCTVENITLRPYGNPLDKYIYTISPLHQTRQAESSQNTLRVSNVTIDGSMHDGISAQGSGDVWIENCTVRNVRHKGIHWGTKCDKIIVRGNLCVGCGSAESEKVSNNGGTGAMYYCSRNQRVIIEGNRMVDCYRGVFGFDYRSNGETDTDSVVAENVFDNCTISGISPIGIGGTGCQLKITGNVFRRFTGNAVPITFTQAKGPLGFVISDNIIGAFQDGYVNAAGAIVVSNAAGLVISGNVIERNPAASGSTDIVIASSTDVAVSANVVDGRIDDTDEGNANIVKSGNIEKIEEVEQ